MVDSWDRWKLGWQHAFFGLLLTVQVARPELLAGGSTGALALRVGLLVALVGWYACWFGPWRTRHPATAPYLVGAVALWVVLVVIHPTFWIIGFAVLIPLAMRRPAWAAIAVAWCGSLWFAFRATGTTLAWPEIVASVLTVAAGIACLGYVAALDRAGRTQARLLDELTAAQAERAAAERHAATLAERQRLAREVHDTLTQGFASIILLLEAMQERRDGADTVSSPPPCPSDPPPALDRHLATALRTAQDNLTESRRLVWALQPSPLDETPLPDAVRQQTRQLAEETGIAAGTVVTGDPAPLEPPTEAGILRVVQESLTNARRHAHATAITVTLSYEPDLVLVDIQDNGTGLPADPPPGMGLRAMRQRASELGGTLTIESDPDAGTTIALAVPTRTTAPLGARA